VYFFHLFQLTVARLFN